MNKAEKIKFLEKVNVGDNVEIEFKQPGRVANPKTAIGQIYLISPVETIVAFPGVNVLKDKVDLLIQSYKIELGSITKWKVKNKRR